MRDIDRLIEMGLSRYGVGDLDGALLLWEEALAVEPDNAQAASYVDYVRLNYDVLTEGSMTVERPGLNPYGIEEEPEYQIEILPGEAEPPPAAAAPKLDAVDDGWFDDELPDQAPAAASESPVPSLPESSETPASPAATLELEAHEPPPSDFEDATREYEARARPAHAAATKPDDLDEETAGPTQGFFRGDDLTGGQTQGFFRGDEATSYQQSDEAPDAGFESDEGTGTFQNEGTPGFSNLETEVRKRDLGFVKPVVTIPPKADRSAEPGPAPQSSVAIGTAPTMDRVAFEDASQHAPDEDGRRALRTTRDLPDPARQPSSLDLSRLSEADVMLSHAPTRELGLRAAAAASALPNPADDDLPTGQTDVRAIREAARRNDGDAGIDADTAVRGARYDPIAAASAQLLEEVDADAPANESAEDARRRRITSLLAKAASLAGAGQYDRAAMAAELVLSEDPNSAVAQKLITRHRDAITAVFQNYLGDLDRTPRLAKSMTELSGASISPRAAFLLSRIDGMLTLDELLDVSGMPKLEAFRYLCQLYLRGVLR